jgi:predicted CoA-substrate-specific enzyme activase
MTKRRGKEPYKSMLVAGIDVGAATAKTVILNEGEICSYAIMPTGFDVVRVSHGVIESALEKCGSPMEDLKFIISTGYARNAIPFKDKALTEILCHARGANFLMPEVRTVIDIGGQDSKVIRVSETGNVLDFVMNDKCAAGTGRFFEVMAGVLELDIGEMGPISLKSEKPSRISSTCTVFAETEMISLRAQGAEREDIVAGIHRAAALRIASMGRNVGFRKEVMLSGGVSKNRGIKKFLEEKIEMEIITPEEPQVVGALGAALLAHAELSKQDGTVRP